MLQVETGDCPHTLFYGPTGAGKKTLIMGLLRQIYGAPVERLKVGIQFLDAQTPTAMFAMKLRMPPSSICLSVFRSSDQFLNFVDAAKTGARQSCAWSHLVGILLVGGVRHPGGDQAL